MSPKGSSRGTFVQIMTAYRMVRGTEIALDLPTRGIEFFNFFPAYVVIRLWESKMTGKTVYPEASQALEKWGGLTIECSPPSLPLQKFHFEKAGVEIHRSPPPGGDLGYIVCCLVLKSEKIKNQ